MKIMYIRSRGTLGPLPRECETYRSSSIALIERYPIATGGWRPAIAGKSSWIRADMEHCDADSDNEIRIG